MSLPLPNRAKKYLSESLDRRTVQSPLSELAQQLKEYYGGGYGYYTPKAPKTPKTKTSDPKKELPPSGGFGVGGPKGKKGDTSKQPDNILFGDVDPEDLGLGTATGLYAAGKAADVAADWLEASGMEKIVGPAASALSKATSKIPVIGGIAGAIGSGALASIPGAGANILRQLSDISGANWAEANISRIGRSTQELAAQGAGSPWTPLALPQTTKTKVKPYDPSAKRKEAIEAAKEEEEIKNLRNKGYSIP
jgi:hypothetical protein